MCPSEWRSRHCFFLRFPMFLHHECRYHRMPINTWRNPTLLNSSANMCMSKFSKSSWYRPSSCEGQIIRQSQVSLKVAFWDFKLMSPSLHAHTLSVFKFLLIQSYWPRFQVSTDQTGVSGTWISWFGGGSGLKLFLSAHWDTCKLFSLLWGWLLALQRYL